MYYNQVNYLQMIQHLKVCLPGCRQVAEVEVEEQWVVVEGEQAAVHHQLSFLESLSGCYHCTLCFHWYLGWCCSHWHQLVVEVAEGVVLLLLQDCSQHPNWFQHLQWNQSEFLEFLHFQPLLPEKVPGLVSPENFKHMIVKRERQKENFTTLLKGGEKSIRRRRILKSSVFFLLVEVGKHHPHPTVCFITDGFISKSQFLSEFVDRTGKAPINWFHHTSVFFSQEEKQQNNLLLEKHNSRFFLC